MNGLQSRKLGFLSFGVLATLAFTPACYASSAAAPSSTPDVAAQVAVKSDESGKAALDFVRSTAEKGLTFLSNPESTQDQKKKEFRKLLDNSFDLDVIGRFALGKYWNVATPAQQSQYLTLFRKMVVEVYARRFGDYKGQKFEVKSSRAIGKTDSLVSSHIIQVNGSEPITVDWRVRKTGDTYKVVDVLVAGVSMSVTQRSDFSSVIQRGGGSVDVLIAYLKEKF